MVKGFFNPSWSIRDLVHMESVIHSIQSGRVVHLPVKIGVFPHKDYNNMPAPALVVPVA